MIGQANVGSIFLLADGALERQIVPRLGAPCVCRHDPYEALAELQSRRFAAAVLTAPRPEFASLCRAARRLVGSGRLLALCTSAAEPEVHALSPNVLDDYFIYPPTGDELASVVGVAPGPVAPAEAKPTVEGFSSDDFSRLVESARSVRGLEACVAGMLGGRLGLQLTWKNLDEAGAGTLPLLVAAGLPPRALVSVSSQQAPDGTAALVGGVSACMPALLEAARRAESLHRLAVTDHLTGAYNRRYFYHVTDQILQRSGGGGSRATLLLYDIDNFKHYNDTYGYAAGDEILRETAVLMRQITRSQDIVARIGGDEFAVLFWDADAPRVAGSKPPENPFVLAERFRRAVCMHEFPSLGPEASGALTISGGLANFPGDGKTVRELLRKADECIKAAKRSGKNAIYLVGGV